MDSQSLETTTVTLDANGESRTLDVPTGAFEVLAEDDAQVDVMTDLALFELTRNIHAAAHHSEVDPEIPMDDIEDEVLDLFEDNFDVSFAEATGHDH
ncbi:MAG: hypothetical protein ABEJ86_02975 [Halococcoides sp.]